MVVGITLGLWARSEGLPKALQRVKVLLSLDFLLVALRADGPLQALEGVLHPVLVIDVLHGP